MDHFAGLDVSVKETSVCIVDDTGRIVREVKVASEPEALAGGAEEPRLSLQADWIGSRAAVAMAVQRARRSRLASDLCGDAAHAGAVFGLTCSKYQSGEIDWSGRISRCGDEMMRVMLYEAAQSMMHSKKWSWLKAWAMQIARRRGMKKAIVALARRLAVIMHRIWVDGTEFRWTREVVAA